jgi:hypothetical protein
MGEWARALGEWRTLDFEDEDEDDDEGAFGYWLSAIGHSRVAR